VTLVPSSSHPAASPFTLRGPYSAAWNSTNIGSGIYTVTTLPVGVLIVQAFMIATAAWSGTVTGQGSWYLSLQTGGGGTNLAIYEDAAMTATAVALGAEPDMSGVAAKTFKHGAIVPADATLGFEAYANSGDWLTGTVAIYVLTESLT